MDRHVRTTGYALAVGRTGLAAALTILALALVGGARADLAAPTITIGTISVADGTVTLDGAVDENGAWALLQINGQPVGVDATGAFSAVVDLEGDRQIVLTLTGQDETAKITIPLTALGSPGTDPLALLNDAGISVDVPENGFEVVDGKPPVVTGSVANEKSLTSLTVNGKDALVQMGQGGTFAVPAQGASSQSGVTVVATDTRGVSQTSTFSVTNVRSTIRTRAGTSVSAAGARGILIAKVRFDKRNLRTAKRLGVVVTVKDRRGFLIRGAALRLNGKPLRYLANGSARAGFTNRIGKARFTYRLHSRAFANCGCTKCTLRVRASTPSASKTKWVRLRLPRLAPV
jgi:hypothetical protein